uniref:Acetyl-coenzyme A synthetase N-terminal domain-containing protein n=1 Tax=Hippocampus comes TaxID=109280 RepID=A0A3Q2XSN6_HIPCM
MWPPSRRCVQAAAASLGRRRRSHAAWAFMPEAAEFQGVRDRAGLHEFSVAHKETFWAAVARHRLDWISPFRGVLDCDLERGEVSWFRGGRLNVSGECGLRFAPPTWRRARSRAQPSVNFCPGVFPKQAQ